MFIDAIHYNVRDEVGVHKKAAYVVLVISAAGHKDVPGIYISENESAKYWLFILNELKNRGVKDIMIICADGLIGIREAMETAFPQTEYQRCIVHQVRNTLKYASEKDKKAFANDLRRIYTAPNEELAMGELDRVKEEWQTKYPNSMKSWYKNWDAISPIFKFSSETRRVVYTTNAIESLNSIYRRLNSQRSASSFTSIEGKRGCSGVLQPRNFERFSGRLRFPLIQSYNVLPLAGYSRSVIVRVTDLVLS